MALKKSLYFRISFFFLAASLIPLLATFFLFYAQARRNTRNIIKQNTENLISELEVITKERISDALGHIVTLASSDLMRSADTPLDEKSKAMQEAHKYFKLFDDITLLDNSGVVLSSLKYDFRGDWKHKKWFKAALAGAPAVSPAHVIPYPSRFVIMLTAPIFSEDGAVKAVLAGRIGLERIWEITDKVKVGSTGFIFMTDSNGKVISFPDKDRILYKITPEQLRVELTSKSSGTIEFIDEKNSPRICFYKTIMWDKQPGEEWRIGLIQDKQEAYALVLGMLRQIRLIAAVSILAIFILAFFLTSKIVRPIRFLVEASSKVAKGNFESKVVVASEDEIGELGRSFNKMIADLKKITVSRDDLIKEMDERKKAQDELKRAYEKLKEAQTQLVQSAKMASVGTLAGGVAHEINNPLTGILNNAQLIKMLAAQKKEFSLDEFKELIDVIEESAQRCTKITRSLLDFSRTAKGELHQASVNDAVDKVVTLVGHELKLQNITIHKRLAQNLPFVLADPQLIQQIVFDIIANAKWAIQKKDVKADDSITITTQHDTANRQVLLSIADTGIGISKENLERIFDPFFTTKGVGEGTGLGLSIVFNIIKEHKGTITAQSEVGKGMTVKIALPIEERSK